MNKVLYVDDELINLEILRISLRKSYDVITAESGVEGLEILQENQEIHHVISDLKMPNMDGMEFIQQAKALRPNLKYYILSGFQMNEEIQEALQKKTIVDFFKKPFDLDYIIETLEAND